MRTITASIKSDSLFFVCLQRTAILIDSEDNASPPSSDTPPDDDGEFDETEINTMFYSSSSSACGSDVALSDVEIGSDNDRSPRISTRARTRLGTSRQRQGTRLQPYLRWFDCKCPLAGETSCIVERR